MEEGGGSSLLKGAAWCVAGRLCDCLHACRVAVKGACLDAGGGGGCRVGGWGCARTTAPQGLTPGTPPLSYHPHLPRVCTLAGGACACAVGVQTGSFRVPGVRGADLAPDLPYPPSDRPATPLQSHSISICPIIRQPGTPPHHAAPKKPPRMPP